MAEQQFVITPSIAPRIIYAHTDGDGITNIDRMAPFDPRERAICRALLMHALKLIDAEAF